jgi:hypothetical protein
MRDIVFDRVVELSELPNGWQIQRISPGPDGEVILQAAPPVDPRLTAETGEYARALQLAQRRYYHVDRGSVTTLRPTRPGFLHVQPFGPGRILWVDGRCSGEYKNAFVQNESGTTEKTFHLGDGIDDVQVASDLSIWVGYFDEGVFGRSVGTAGLARFSEKGDLQFDFNASSERLQLPYIADCYAFNVARDGVYAYYYTDFPLIRISEDKAAKICQVPISGSHAFAVAGDRALFIGSYNSRVAMYSVYLPSGKVDEYRPVNQDGEIIALSCAAGRGSVLYIAAGCTLYLVDISHWVL